MFLEMSYIALDDSTGLRIGERRAQQRLAGFRVKLVRVIPPPPIYADSVDRRRRLGWDFRLQPATPFIETAQYLLQDLFLGRDVSRFDGGAARSRESSPACLHRISHRAHPPELTRIVRAMREA